MTLHPTARLTLALVALATVAAVASPRQVTFGAVATPVKVGGPFDVTVTVEAPDARDCAKDVVVTGALRMRGRKPLPARGTCERPDGASFRVRFVPPVPGDYDWTVTYTQAEYVRTGHGSVSVVPE